MTPRTALSLMVALAACSSSYEAPPADPAASGEVTTPDDAGAEAPADADTEAAAEVAMVAPTRATVIELTQREKADGSWELVAAGPPQAPTAHYAGDTPAGMTPGTYDAVFKGAELGDYPHILFEVDVDQMDFGAGNNQFAGTPFAGKDIDELDALKGKSFALTWEYRPSDFLCCEGDMTLWRGMKPSITALEVLD